MAQVTIYVPDWLHGRVKAAGLNVSRVCQDAFRAQLGIAPDGTDHSQALQELATGLDIPAETLAADDGINHWTAATTCPHPAKERTSYGRCRLCGQDIRP